MTDRQDVMNWIGGNFFLREPFAYVFERVMMRDEGGGGGGSVSSVFGRTGAVTAQTGDYSAAQISGLGTAATQNSTNFAPSAHVGSGGISQHALATTSLAGFMSDTDKTKLNGIATGATANQTDAYLLARANHTGTQAATTITGLATVATTGAYGDLSGIPSPYTLPAATISTIGGVKPGTGLTVDPDGTLNASGGGGPITDLDVTGSTTFSGIISPAELTANQNNYDPTGLSGATNVRISANNNRTITGIAGGAEGRTLILHNVTNARTLTLTHNGTGSLAENRFITPGSASYLLGPASAVIIQYDSTSTRWRIVGPAISSGGGSGTVTDVSVVTANGVSATVATSTTTPAITIALGDITPTKVGAATAAEIDYLSGVTSDVQTQLNGKQGSLTLTTTGTSGAASLVGDTLNIPNYATGGGGGGLPDGDYGDIIVSGSGTVLTVDNNAITLAKIQTLSANRFLGRVNNVGIPQQLTLTNVLDSVGSAADGDMLYRTGSTWMRLPVGSSADVLTVSSGLPVWQAPSGGGGGGGATKATSGQLTITTAGSATWAHGLGAQPDIVKLYLECLTSENNFVAGEWYDPSVMSMTAPRGVNIMLDATNITLNYGNNATVFQMVNNTGGAAVALTNTRWAVRLVAAIL